MVVATYMVNGDEPGALSVLGPQKLTISGEFLGLFIFYYPLGRLFLLPTKKCTFFSLQ
jgi:hypothetical protein